MINLCFLLKRLSSTGRIQCFAYPVSAMAPTEWEFTSDDNPWNVSTFVSAIVELFLSILLLLGAAIAFITSRFVKIFGLEPPCTYIGCSHPLHFESFRARVCAASASCKSKNLCTGEFCRDRHPSSFYSKLRSNEGSNHEEESISDGGHERNVFSSRDQNKTQNNNVDASNVHLSVGGYGHEMHLSSCDHPCSCSNCGLYRRWNQGDFTKCTTYARAASSRNLDEDDLPLLSARSSAESSGGFNAEDQCEISEASADSEEERAWKETCMKGDEVLHNDASFAHNNEALLEDANRKIYGVSVRSAEPLALNRFDDECEEPKVSMNNIHELVSRREAKSEALENQGPSPVQSTEKGKGKDASNINICRYPFSSSVDVQEAEIIQSVGGRHDKKGRMFEACNEGHYHRSLPDYIEKECNNQNSLNQEVQLPDELCLTAHCVGTCMKSNDAGCTTDHANGGYVSNGTVDDRGLANIGIHFGNSQGAGSNESLYEIRCFRESISKNNLKPAFQRAEDERTMYDDDDCLGKGLFLVSLDLGSQKASGEGVAEACLECADASFEKDGTHLEGIVTSSNIEQEELSMKYPSRGVKGDVFDNAVSTEESPHSPASLNATTKSSVQSFSLAQCGKSSTLVEGMALLVWPSEANEDEGDTVSEEEEEEGLDALKVALQAERSSLAALEAELENERNAAAVATSEAMAMISRLQEEKSAMQMEVAQWQRMSEEKADYDEQAMTLLKEILFKRETENMALEKEVELYRERLWEEKGDELKGNSFKEEAESASPHSVKRLLLAGENDELLSSMNQQQALVSSAKFYHSGTRSALCVPQHGPNMDMEEPNAFSLDQNVNKRSRDSSRSDKVVGMSSSTVWDDDGKQIYNWDGGFYGQHSSCEQLRKMGRSVVSTDDEESQSILERLWVLEEELQKLRGKDDSGGQKLRLKAHEVKQLIDGGPTHKWADGSLTDVWGQLACGIKSMGEGEALELDGVAGGYVPVHDVYEVHSTSNRSPPCTEEGDPLEGLQGVLKNSELPPETFVPDRMARHRTQQVPSRISQTRKMLFSDEIPHTPTFMPQAAGWIVGKSSYPGSPCEHYDPPSQSLVSRGEKRMELEEIQQLAVRLKALEEDRELLRETLESFKHRDAELSLLQEIAQHLRELRMAGLIGLSGGVLQEEMSITSPSKSRALKKRRYCSDPGQAQMHLLQQKSI